MHLFLMFGDEITIHEINDTIHNLFHAGEYETMITIRDTIELIEWIVV